MKELLEQTKLFDTNNYESRAVNNFIDTSVRENYLFNSKINGTRFIPAEKQAAQAVKNWGEVPITIFTRGTKNEAIVDESI